MPPPDGDRLRAFVDDVACRRFGACFAMLADEDPALDAPGAAAARRANLVSYLHERTREPCVILAGEAMGYAGGRFTGIAFTAERSLIAWGSPYTTTSLRPEGFAEQSGTIVHGLLGNLDAERRVLLWNVVPAHPHRPGKPLSNRPPTVGERRGGGDVLGELIELVRPRAIIPVGRTAATALTELAIAAAEPVRHPANGGATQFRRECAERLRPLL